MFKFSYSANGLTELDLCNAIDEVKNAGYDGIELSFQKNDFNPFKVTDEEIIDLRKKFSETGIQPVCISTATTFFLSDIAHEPSLISIDEEKRKKRIDLIKKGIKIAKKLDVPIVSFQSGYLREEHIKNKEIDPMKLLISGIKECLIDIEDIILVIEPELGMYIETLEEGLGLIKAVNSEQFKLHIDICHAYCTEKDYISSICKYIPHTKYMHLADIKEGYNLKFYSMILEELKNLEVNFNFASYFIYLNEYNLYLFTFENSTYCFYYKGFENNRDEFISKVKNTIFFPIEIIEIDKLKVAQNEEYDIEIKAYLDSISKVSHDILMASVPILKYIRAEKLINGEQLIKKPICNTINGKVHYHEMPGNGQINFAMLLNRLKNEYDSFITIELYNHSSIWKKVLPNSRNYLINCMK